MTRPGPNLVFCSDPILTRPCKILAQSTTSCGCRHFALIRKRYRHMARLRKGLGTWPLLKSCVATWLLLSKGVGTWLIFGLQNLFFIAQKTVFNFFYICNSCPSHTTKTKPDKLSIQTIFCQCRFCRGVYVSPQHKL